MKDWTTEQEAENLRKRFEGVNRAAFAREHGLSGGQAMIYQHINGLRRISLDAARVYANAFECDLAEISPRLAAEVASAAKFTSAAKPGMGGKPGRGAADVEWEDEPNPDDVPIPQFETGGKMGDGLELRDQPGMIKSWRVDLEWLHKNVRGATAAGNLCIVTGFGDSMRPMFNPGDPLLVDRGVTTADYDAVYFFRVDGEGFIKRLQRIPGKGLVALSENPAYQAWVVEPTMDFEVFGRVLKVWRSEDF